MNIQNKHIVREKNQTQPKNKPKKQTKTKPLLLSEETDPLITLKQAI